MAPKKIISEETAKIISLKKETVPSILTEEQLENVQTVLNFQNICIETLNTNIFHNLAYREYGAIFQLREFKIEPTLQKNKNTSGHDAACLDVSRPQKVEIKGSYLSESSEKNRVIRFIDGHWGFDKIYTDGRDDVVLGYDAFAFCLFTRTGVLPIMMYYIHAEPNLGFVKEMLKDKIIEKRKTYKGVGRDDIKITQDDIFKCLGKKDDLTGIEVIIFQNRLDSIELIDFWKMWKEKQSKKPWISNQLMGTVAMNDGRNILKK